jgi:hypothetical protein
MSNSLRKTRSRGQEAGEPSYRDLNEYIERSGKRKNFVARVELQIDPPRLSELLKSDTWRPRVDDDLARRIAEVLHQPLSYVREIYPEAA